MAINNPYAVYKNNSVNLASKEQLLLMLVDGAVKFSKMSRQALVDKNYKSAHEYLVRTQDIFLELMASLDVSTGGDWAKQLMSVYEFINYSLTQANIKKDLETLDKTLPIIEDIRDTWQEAYKISKVNG